MIAPIKLTTDDNSHQGPDPRKWIVLDEAAELLGCDRSHLARECRRTLEGFGRAKKATPEGGGKAKWFIARRHDLRLAPGVIGEAHQGPDLSGYSKDQRDEAYARLACVKAYREARTSWRGPQGDWLPRLIKQLKAEHPSLKISPRSLRRWHGSYNNPADLVKLVSKAGGNRRGEADPACWDAFKSVYLDQNRPSLADCWRQVDAYARKTGLRWLTESACRSQLNKRISPEEQARFRDPKAYRDKFAPYIEYEPTAYDAGHRWDGDHCVLDLWCWSGEGESRKLIRPWITAWIDWRTRKIVGWHLSDAPNSQTILSALRKGILDESNHGGPHIVWIDNGRDYASYMFHGRTKRDRQDERRERMLRKDRVIKREMGRLAKIEGGIQIDESKTSAGVFTLLDIDPHFANPYNHKGKGRIERWFRTMHASFDKRFPTYCGSSPDKRPEDLEKVFKKKPQSIPTFETVQVELEAWIANYNAKVSNRKGAEGLSPDQAMAVLPHTKRPAKNAQALKDCLAMWHRPVKVTRNGVLIRIGSVSYSYGQYDPRLSALKQTGVKVHVSYDPDDMRTVEVYDEKHVHLCTANRNPRAGHGSYARSHKKNQKQKTDYKRREKLRAELRKTDIADVVAKFDPVAGAAMADAALERSKPREVALQPKLESSGPVVNLADLVRQGEANTAADADAKLDQFKPVNGINLGDLTDRVKRAGEREAAKRKAEAINDEDDIDVMLELSQLQFPLPTIDDEDDDDVVSLADLDFIGEGGAA